MKKILVITEADMKEETVIPFLINMRKFYKQININDILIKGAIEFNQKMEDGTLFKTTIALRDYDI